MFIFLGMQFYYAITNGFVHLTFLKTKNQFLKLLFTYVVLAWWKQATRKKPVYFLSNSVSNFVACLATRPFLGNSLPDTNDSFSSHCPLAHEGMENVLFGEVGAYRRNSLPWGCFSTAFTFPSHAKWPSKQQPLPRTISFLSQTAASPALWKVLWGNGLPPFLVKINSITKFLTCFVYTALTPKDNLLDEARKLYVCK